MNLDRFLAELAKRGVKLWVEGDTLRFRAAKGVLTSEDRDILVLHKAKAISLLSQNNTTANDTARTIVPISEKQDIPVSFPQEQLWFVSQLQPNNSSYNELFALRFLGVLNIFALEQSLNKIVARHAALRTNFTTVNGQPVQLIAESLTLTVSVIDLSNLPASDREIEVQRLATEQAQKPFDLISDPLIQATVLKLTETEHIFLLRTHHIVWDGWSLGIMWRELAAFYNDLSQELPPLPAQYPDFAVWQRQSLTDDVLDRVQTYWQEQLLDAPPLLELPTDRVRGVTQTFRGKHYRFVISKPLTEALIGLSRRQKVTLFMTLLAAFQTLLYRYTGQTDICVGSPIANRARPEFEGLIGYFVNTLVLRTCLSGNPSFEDLLSRVREVTLRAYAHRELPFGKLVQTLQPERSLSYTPLFQVMLMLLNELPDIQMESLTVSPFAVETGMARTDLTLCVEKTDKGLIGEWEYNTDLFDDATIARMTGHFQTLLEAIATNPEQQISELPLLTQTERQQLLFEWNNTWAEYPKDKCIHQLFEEQVERSPDAVAVVFEGEQLTYRELNAKANQLANYLKTLGVEPEVLVGICIERSSEMVVGLLAILKAGGAYVPLDPASPIERLAFMLEDTQISVLLTKAQLVESLPKHQGQIVCLDTQWEEITQQSEENPISGVTSDNLAYVIYTSGSTGKPKGVCCNHVGIVNLYADFQSRKPLFVGDRCSLWTSLNFDVSVYEIFSALLAGAALHIVPELIRLDAITFFNWLHSQQICSAYIPPFMLNDFSDWLDRTPNKSLQRLLVGVEPIYEQLLISLSQRISGLHIINGYGPTETTICATLYSVQLQGAGNRNTPIGLPVQNTEIYLLDDQMQLVPIGVIGEIYIGGIGLARGYLNRPDLTLEKFIPNPFSSKPGERLYKTGDKARYLSDGNIEYLGRIDNQVKIRGFRIELGEIEAVLSQHPLVQGSAVVAREDTPGDKRLVAYLVPALHRQTLPQQVAQWQSEYVSDWQTLYEQAYSQNQASTEVQKLVPQVRSFIQQKLPDYMVPQAFVLLNALPLTPNGKVDRRSLPAPDTATKNLSTGFVLPRTPIEAQLVQIWSEVLGVERIGVKDNFFELGGHSLLATQMVSRINSAFGLDLSIQMMFESPTVAGIASYMEVVDLVTQDLSIKEVSSEVVEF